MQKTFTLYGMTASLYTAKVRSYLRQNQVPFKEVKAGSKRYNAVVRKAVGRWIVPVLETPDGEFIQDGTNILDYLEKNGWSKRSFIPQQPELGIVAHLFELFGSEGLLRPAMHYRWNFNETNLEFLKSTFEDVLPDNLSEEDYDAAFQHSSGLMRKATLFFGAIPEAQPTIEQSYAEFLDLLNKHFAERPYLFGAYPTVGDYAMLGPLWAHLGRDPKPLHLMQTKAPRVFRWTERMNMAEHYEDGATLKAGESLLDFANIPESLIDLMRFISADYLPEILAHIDFTNNWLEKNPSPREAHNPADRSIGGASFKWRGHNLTTAVMPYRFFLLQRLQDAFDQLNPAQKASVRSLFAGVGAEEFLDRRVKQRVVRENHLETWQA